MTPADRWISRLSAWLAHRLPARLRVEFGGEVEEVMHARLADAYARGRHSLAGALLRELADLPLLYLRGGLARIKGVIMQTNQVFLEEKAHQPVPWGLALLGLLPLLWGPLFSLYVWITTQAWLFFKGTLPTYTDPAYIAFFGTFVSVLLVLIVIVLLMGWLRGFPEWVYPLMVQFVLFTLYIKNASVPGLVLFGYSFGRRLLGFYALIPLAVLILAALLLTVKDMSKPFKTGLARLKQDVTLLCFGLYGLTPLLLRGAFDEVRGEEPFLVAFDILLALCGLVYMRARAQSRRLWALFGSLLLAWTASSIYTGIYWNGRMEDWMDRPGNGWESFTGTLIFGLVISLVTIAPWILQQMDRRSQKEKPA